MHSYRQHHVTQFRIEVTQFSDSKVTQLSDSIEEVVPVKINALDIGSWEKIW